MNFFEILAECSIALTGFGAIHAALRGADHPRGVFRAWTVVLFGATAFLLCILPLLLALTDLSSERLWILASSVGLLIAVAAAISGFKFDNRLTEIGYPPQSPIMLRVAQTSIVIAVMVLLSTVIGWPTASGLFFYAIAPVSLLVAGLLAMLHAFLVPMQMVFTQKQPQTPEADEADPDERVL